MVVKVGPVPVAGEKAPAGEVVQLYTAPAMTGAEYVAVPHTFWGPVMTSGGAGLHSGFGSHATELVLPLNGRSISLYSHWPYRPGINGCG